MAMLRMGTQGTLREENDGNRGDHAALQMRCARDRAKQGLRWAWGTVGGFDPGSDLGRRGQEVEVAVAVAVAEVRTAGGFEHLESLAYQDRSSREVQKSRKQGMRLWRLWQH